jgi:hypothetical protein
MYLDYPDGIQKCGAANDRRERIVKDAETVVLLVHEVSNEGIQKSQHRLANVTWLQCL